jgi:NIMA (never in mitosis gene a)-related kinase
VQKSQVTFNEEDDSLEAQGYGFLIKDMKRCLKKKRPEDEEETFVDNFKLSP